MSPRIGIASLIWGMFRNQSFIMNKKEFIAKCEVELRSRFMLELNDVDDEALLSYHIDGWTPEEAIEHIGNKYSLQHIQSAYHPFGVFENEK